VQNLLAGLKVGGIVAIVALGFAFGHGDASTIDRAGPRGRLPWLLALVPGDVQLLGMERRGVRRGGSARSRRNVPLALGSARRRRRALSAAERALSVRAADRRARGGAGRTPDGHRRRAAARARGGNLLALFTIVGLSASISAMVLAGPRVYFAMARDGMFVRAAGRVHPRFHTPAAAIVAQSAVEQRARALGHAVAARELHRVRRRAVLGDRGRRAVRAAAARRRQRAARVFGDRLSWAPALFVAASAVMLANEMWRNPVPTLAGAR
jgi:APA family basic amino acid/polyamine antiporter